MYTFIVVLNILRTIKFCDRIISSDFMNTGGYSETMTEAVQDGKAAAKYDCLKLENQLCFPLYAVSKEIIRRYKPFLDELDLTYTQYIAMMVMWEEKELNVKELGRKLFLDSGTLTPVLKKLESKGYITRTRSKEDERNLIVCITQKGEELKETACGVPEKMSCCVKLSNDEAACLYQLLYKVLGSLEEQG